jgi:hypothetical protein
MSIITKINQKGRERLNILSVSKETGLLGCCSSNSMHQPMKYQETQINLVNKAKIKGSAFEHKVTVLMNNLVEGSDFRRVPGSGAMGTTLNESLLMADVVGTVPGFFAKIRAECKAGYNHSTDKEVKQFTLQKEWLDKVKMEAKLSFGFPVLFGKFDNARDGVKVFVVMDIEDFAIILNRFRAMSEELEKR